jgi:hypothetical protein
MIIHEGRRIRLGKEIPEVAPGNTVRIETSVFDPNEGVQIVQVGCANHQR